MVDMIYPAELRLNKANSSDTEVPFVDLNLSISNGRVSTKLYDKRDNFDIVNLPILDGAAPRSTSYGVIYTSQLHVIRSREQLLTLVTSIAVTKPNCQVL